MTLQRGQILWNNNKHVYRTFIIIIIIIINFNNNLLTLVISVQTLISRAILLAKKKKKKTYQRGREKKCSILSSLSGKSNLPTTPDINNVVRKPPETIRSYFKMHFFLFCLFD